MALYRQLLEDEKAEDEAKAAASASVAPKDVDTDKDKDKDKDESASDVPNPASEEGGEDEEPAPVSEKEDSGELPNAEKAVPAEKAEGTPAAKSAQLSDEELAALQEESDRVADEIYGDGSSDDDDDDLLLGKVVINAKERPVKKKEKKPDNVIETNKIKEVPLSETLRQAIDNSGLEVNYTDIFEFIKAVDPSAVRLLEAKYNPIDVSDYCDKFIQFMATLSDAGSQRQLSVIISEIVSYLKKNANETFTAIDIITYCNKIHDTVEDKNVFALKGVGYTRMKIMVENAFIIEYLSSYGIAEDLRIGNGVDDATDTVVQLAVAVAYGENVSKLGDIADKYIVAYRRIQSDKPELMMVLKNGDFEAFYNMLRTFCGSSTVGIDLRDIDLNMESYSQGEAAALYAAVIAKMDELAAKYRKSYSNEDIERIIDSMVSRGYRASQTNAIEYYCEEMINPKKPIKSRNDKDVINFDQGMNFATRAYIPAGYGLSKSHVEISKPYTEVFGIPFINIRHPLFKAIAMKYTTKYSTKNKTKNGKKSAIDKEWEKRAKAVQDRADKAEKQLIKEIKGGSLMSKFLVGDQTKETQIAGEGLDMVSTIEKGLRKITSFASNSILIKNILELIKMAMDGDETPVSRSTLVVAANQMSSYDRNPIVSNMVNDQFANVRVFNPVKPERSAAVSKKYLKQFYDIINPLENADEYIACGAFSPNLPSGVGGHGMFRAQMQTVSGGAIDPSAVSDAAIAAFRQDILEHGGYPFTYVLSDQYTGENNQVYRIARNNNFFGNLARLDVDLVAIHVKKAGMDGIFIMENHDAEVLFS
ncbi:MAG: hypothetical protein IKN15_02705 [Bacteroidaceae bacterium]|nr:hypothetical protein [Bacteroidaceae bacterium]